MRTTTDTRTGKRFRWNTTVKVDGLLVPAGSTRRKSTWFHPNRVSKQLLRELNPTPRSISARADIEAADGRRLASLSPSLPSRCHVRILSAA